MTGGQEEALTKYTGILNDIVTLFCAPIVVIILLIKNISYINDDNKLILIGNSILHSI